MRITDIRSIPGVQEVLDKCHADIQALTGYPITLNFSLKFHYLSTRVLVGIVTDVCEVKWDNIVSSSRRGSYVIARHLYCYFAREYQQKTFYDIAQIINRDHTSVMHAIQSIKDMIEVKDDLYMTYFTEIENRVKNHLVS